MVSFTPAPPPSHTNPLSPSDLIGGPLSARAYSDRIARRSKQALGSSPRATEELSMVSASGALR